jgi:hypothetical protein
MIGSGLGATLLAPSPPRSSTKASAPAMRTGKPRCAGDRVRRSGAEPQEDGSDRIRGWVGELRALPRGLEFATSVRTCRPRGEMFVETRPPLRTDPNGRSVSATLGTGAPLWASTPKVGGDAVATVRGPSPSGFAVARTGSSTATGTCVGPPATGAFTEGGGSAAGDSAAAGAGATAGGAAGGAGAGAGAGGAGGAGDGAAGAASAAGGESGAGAG